MIGVVVMAIVVWTVRRQRKLALRARLMREAMRNHDFTFRLPTDGLLPGERAMQEALNQLGETIRQQVNQREVEAWERLTRVLTHEMMNATAPITSISQSLLGRDDVKGTPIEEGVRAIYASSHHLSVFVDSYRKLSQLQQPAVADVCLAAIVADACRLYPDVVWDCRVDNDAVVSADPNMLHQILLNLVKNAVEAGARRMAMTYEGTALYVSNDGQPVPAEARGQIFVPFFTTKRSGSGVGLSLSRRMMVQQGGNLTLADQPRMGYRTTFVVEFS